MTLSRALLPAVVVAGLALTGCDIQPNDNTLPGQVAVGDDGYTVEVHFDQIENLVPNSTVQKDNVVIGTVGEIRAEGWEAVVDLHLLDDVVLPADAVFSIGQKTLLGAQYVEVSAPDGSTGTHPAGARLAEGAVVPVAQTGTYPATEQVLGAVALLLNNGGLSQISTITGELSTALRDRVPDTRGLIRHTNDLLSVLDANKSEIVRALESLNSLSAGLRQDQQQIATAIDRITPGLKVLDQERNRLVKAVTRTSRTGVRASEVIRASETALLANLDSLGPILEHLGQASESLPESLKIALTIPFPVMTARNALRGDYANLFATLDLRDSSLLASWLGLIGVPATPPADAAAPETPAVPEAPVPAPGTPAPTEPTTSGDVQTPAAPAEPVPDCGLLKKILGGC
ncbi:MULTISPECIES: MCE family protein [unclassified Nocardioides]|uniref:MCE family protein n=1 Tax=unclassified Nocardioides TaxID=2615069 RepID=UPI001150C277|nr:MULTISPECIES: MCE family protein [unclassified Nocardioides]TQK68370.1 phospholipid/cholesterol/gamma-HCH transport system substrate-binding protein [Nocardioides sp. SLBN-35]WGY02316.1 MCE family protein [Nocardioides sp. QY071]